MKLKDVKSFLIRDVVRRYQEIPQKEEEIVRIANVVTEWSDVFAGTLPDRYVHLIAWIPGMLSNTMFSILTQAMTLVLAFFRRHLGNAEEVMGKG